MSLKTIIKRLAAFGAGIALWEAIVHASLLISRQRPRIFGIQLTDRVNLIQTVVPSIVAIALGRYAFAARRRVQPVVPL
jgi:hypothetical protein